jgi:hypothetical protein
MSDVRGEKIVREQINLRSELFNSPRSSPLGKSRAMSFVAIHGKERDALRTIVERRADSPCLSAGVWFLGIENIHIQDLRESSATEAGPHGADR